MATINLVPYKPVSGVASDATAIDNAFDTLQAFANGGIDNNNVAGGAGIDPLKIAGTLGKIYDSTASGAVASFDVTSIPSTYAHLKLVLYARGDTAAAAIAVNCRFNNDSGANYSTQSTVVNGTTVGPSEALAGTSFRLGRAPAATAPASSFGSLSAEIAQYAGATGHKHGTSQVSSREGTITGTMLQESDAFVWFATPAAINRVTVLPSSGNFVAGSRLTVYGMGV